VALTKYSQVIDSDRHTAAAAADQTDAGSLKYLGWTHGRTGFHASQLLVLFLAYEYD